MRFPTQGQFLELLACIFGGIIIGVIYEITHLSGVPKINKWVMAVLDAVFVILGTAVFLLVTYLAGFGEVRIYSIAGFIMGFIAEKFSIKILVAKANRAMYNYIGKINNKFRVRRAERRAARKAKPRKKRRKNDRVTV